MQIFLVNMQLLTNILEISNQNMVIFYVKKRESQFMINEDELHTNNFSRMNNFGLFLFSF